MSSNTILTITGSDPTGESGVQADIRTISSLGCVAVSAITSVTMQNTLGIQEFFDLPPSVVGGQIEAIVNDMQPRVVKVGMVRRAETLDVIVRALRRHKPPFVIYDPVLLSSRGDYLMGDEMLHLVRSRLFPLCSAVVVSRHDAARVIGDAILPEVCYLDDTCHGLANGFSSSLAVYLCKGLPMAEAVEKARDYSRRQVSSVPVLQGRGSQLYNDFLRLVQQHFGSNSDVGYYASQLNVGSAYLGQVCRRIAARSPKAIIDEYVVKDIERQLATTGRTIQEIATSLGFSSQAHLSRFFRKMTGLAPSSFRNNNGQGSNNARTS